MKITSLVWVLGLVFYGFFSFAESPRPLHKVVLVLFENTTYEKSKDAPAFRAVAQAGAILTNYQGITNPSQPNYIALMAGDTMGVYGDGNSDLNASSLADLIEAKGLHWAVYAEAYPGNCFLGKTSGTYARKHNPLISFVNIQNSASRCERITDEKGFARDLSAGRLPEFTHYVPDMNNTGHDTGISGADHFLATTLFPLMQSEEGKKVTWILTFDEGHIFNNHILTLVYGDQVKVGAECTDRYNHYSLLRTIEDGFGLGTLGRNDATAIPFSGIWQ